MAKQRKRKSAEPESPELLPLARAMQEQGLEWFSRAQAGAEDSELALATLEVLRGAMMMHRPKSGLDAAMMIDAARCVAVFLHRMAETAEEGDTPALAQFVKSGCEEIATGLFNARQYLEQQAGTTLADLGVFQDGQRLQ
ncbi:hypothetical protein [Aestuariivirga sp.]|uniref:hypothetical protein n=1 Tax=Aestuariivirga sp. TaxID=2650926 RepID=UPI0039E2C450